MMGYDLSQGGSGGGKENFVGQRSLTIVLSRFQTLVLTSSNHVVGIICSSFP